MQQNTSEQQPSEYLFNEYANNSTKKKWYAKLIIGILKIISLPVVAYIGSNLKERERRTKQLKNKLKYFNPTVHEGFLGKSVSWTGREKPLSDEEVENIWKNTK